MCRQCSVIRCVIPCDTFFVLHLVFFVLVFFLSLGRRSSYYKQFGVTHVYVLRRKPERVEKGKGSVIDRI